MNDIDFGFRRLGTGSAPDPLGEPTTLYRAFDASGRLLYVGIARNWGRRWQQHSERAPWFDQVADLKLTTYPSRSAALVAERLAIIEERPLHNVVHNGQDHRPAINSVPAVATAPAPARHHPVTDFDHHKLFGIPEYWAAVSAIDALANRLSERVTQETFEQVLIDVSRSTRFSDCCQTCIHQHDDWVPVPPFAGTVVDNWFEGSYVCPRCSDRWQCGWNVDIALVSA